MNDFEERLLIEEAELRDKINKLGDFLNGWLTRSIPGKLPFSLSNTRL